MRLPVRKPYAICCRAWTVCFITFLFLLINNKAYSQLEKQLKDKHFVVFYSPVVDETIARGVLRASERYYDRIANEIGYARYANFWTWEERVKVVIFSDHVSFAKTTGQPLWSKGYAQRESQIFKSRSIVTYPQEHDFMDGLLPHEISHLILLDFVGSKSRIPIWFDEGVAQLQEKNKKMLADQLMRKLVPSKQYIPLQILAQWDIRNENDPKKVMVFYAQSLSVVDFMIRNYGSHRFGNLCRGLKDGLSFEKALKSAYTSLFDSLLDLEEKWVRYFK